MALKPIKINHKVLCLLYFIIILALSIVPNPIRNNTINYFLHFLASFTLTLIIYNLVKKHQIKNKMFTTVILSIIVVISLELIQFFIPYRTFSIIDILFGILGIVVYLVISILN